MCSFAASLNDTVDARHDATFHPSRPIPSGWISIAQAVVLMVCSLLLALLATSFLGTWPVQMGLLTAAAILFYNIVGKHIPAVGLVSVGLIYASHMLIANIELTFTLPVWMVMTHAMICATAMYLLEAKRPRLSFRGWMGVLCGWIFWSAVLFSGPLWRNGSLLPNGMEVVSLLWPLAAVAGIAVIYASNVDVWLCNIQRRCRDGCQGSDRRNWKTYLMADLMVTRVMILNEEGKGQFVPESPMR
jgi:hypothetical protein